MTHVPPRTIQAVEAELQRLRRENEQFRKTLEYIAHFGDSWMETARTLHYDMRGWARAALAAAATDEQEHHPSLP